jgi:hypothetical protein
MESISSPDAATDVHPALATVATDQCSSCGTPLAPDQRYCVQCGQRRGQSRLPVAQPVTAAVAPRRESRFAGIGVNTALIAGVGTLLLAMGVGVLIGRSGQKTPAAAAAPQIVTVGGAGAGTTTGAAGSSGKVAKATKSTGKKASAADAQKAATKIKGTNLKLPKKAVVKVGSPGHGPGYQKGKFTGNFFGGG